METEGKENYVSCYGGTLVMSASNQAITCSFRNNRLRTFNREASCRNSHSRGLAACMLDVVWEGGEDTIWNIESTTFETQQGEVSTDNGQES